MKAIENQEQGSSAIYKRVEEAGGSRLSVKWQNLRASSKANGWPSGSVVEPFLSVHRGCRRPIPSQLHSVNR